MKPFNHNTLLVELYSAINEGRATGILEQLILQADLAREVSEMLNKSQEYKYEI